VRIGSWLVGCAVGASMAATAAAQDLDPNRTRLLFAPTARPLDRGEGYVSNTELVFPGVAFGLTDNLSVGGGFSIVPGLGLGEQLFYVSPKLGFAPSPNVALAVGGLFAKPGAEAGSLSMGYGVGTFGPVDRSLSAGVGYVTVPDEGEAWLGMLGGNVTLTKHVALVAESWIDLGDPDLASQPVGVAVRLFGSRLSADLGVVFSGEILDEGLPAPWLSVTYGFGGRSRSSARGPRMPEPLRTSQGRRPGPPAPPTPR
jgi:hypothetical protein